MADIYTNVMVDAYADTNTDVDPDTDTDIDIYANANANICISKSLFSLKDNTASFLYDSFHCVKAEKQLLPKSLMVDLPK